MECPECQSSHVRKNGHRCGKQNHLCVDCGRQLVESPKTERVTGVHHTTVISWVKQVGELLLDGYEPEAILQVGEFDELQTFVGSKKRCDSASVPGARNAHQDK